MNNDEFEIIDDLSLDNTTLTVTPVPLENGPVEPLSTNTQPVIEQTQTEDNNINSVDIEVVDFDEQKKPGIVTEQKVDKQKKQTKASMALTIFLLVMLVIMVIMLPYLSTWFS